MTELEQLRNEISDPAFRTEWKRIINTPIWKKVSKLVFLEAVEEATSTGIQEHDVVAARTLFALKSAKKIIASFEGAAKDKPKAKQLPPEWEDENEQ